MMGPVKPGVAWSVNPVNVFAHESTAFPPLPPMASVTGTVVIVNVQPFVIWPDANCVSSTTYNRHAPEGSVPLNTARDATAFEFPAGAGEGKSPAKPRFGFFVGLNV